MTAAGKGEAGILAGNVDWDGHHCRFCRFLISRWRVLRSNLEFKGDCRGCPCQFAAKVAMTAAKTARVATPIATRTATCATRCVMGEGDMAVHASASGV